GRSVTAVTASPAPRMDGHVARLAAQRPSAPVTALGVGVKHRPAATSAGPLLDWRRSAEPWVGEARASSLPVSSSGAPGLVPAAVTVYLQLVGRRIPSGPPAGGYHRATVRRAACCARTRTWLHGSVVLGRRRQPALSLRTPVRERQGEPAVVRA